MDLMFFFFVAKKNMVTFFGHALARLALSPLFRRFWEFFFFLFDEKLNRKEHA